MQRRSPTTAMLGILAPSRLFWPRVWIIRRRTASEATYGNLQAVCHDIHLRGVKESYVDQAFHSFHGIVGCSPKMLALFASIQKVAKTDVAVLLVGESGTGKERVASAIHQESCRRGNPFVVINCPAIPESLLESELFGYEKGSFTGANGKRSGKIFAAEGGTLFLDELGEIPLGIQSKILRFLQEHVIEPVGGQARKVDVRVIAATNRDLIGAMRTGQFREDLYYRLNGVTLTLPPLRERGEDIFLLAHTFLGLLSKKIGKQVEGFSEEAIKAIGAYPWAGNVREMENRIFRAVIMADEHEITLRDMEIPSCSEQEGIGLKRACEAFEKELIQKTLIKHSGNMTKTARELIISRPALYDLVKRLNINRRYRRVSDFATRTFTSEKDH